MNPLNPLQKILFIIASILITALLFLFFWIGLALLFCVAIYKSIVFYAAFRKMKKSAGTSDEDDAITITNYKIKD